MIIGITGGIGSGKSTVSRILKDKGFCFIDLDIISHDVIQDSKIKAELFKNFGSEIFDKEEISRKKLGKVVFEDKNKLERLNSIMHPEILKRMRKKIEKIKEKIVFVEIQLLFEVGWEREFDLILLVWSDKNTQIKRVLARDKRSENETKNIINSQISLDEKIKKSDYVIENNNDNLEDLKNKIDNFINFLETKLNFKKKEV